MKKCRNKQCSNEFSPQTTLQKYCFDCVVAKSKDKVKKERDKKDRVEKRALKDKLKRVIDYRNEARRVFQRWIRIRDLGFKCISCDTLLTDIRNYDAGHYYNANSYPQLLFNVYNVNGQCKNRCNNHLSGNLIEYRKGLLGRYGAEVLLELETLADDKTKRDLTKEYYSEITVKYRKMIKELENK